MSRVCRDPAAQGQVSGGKNCLPSKQFEMLPAGLTCKYCGDHVHSNHFKTVTSECCRKHSAHLVVCYCDARPPADLQTYMQACFSMKRRMPCGILVRRLLVVVFALLWAGREGLGMPAAAVAAPLLTHSNAMMQGVSSSTERDLELKQVCAVWCCCAQ